MSTLNIYFHGKIRKISVLWGCLFKAILSYSFTFIDHEPRIIQTDSFAFHFFITCLKEIKKSEKSMFLKIEFYDYSTIKNLSNHQLQ